MYTAEGCPEFLSKETNQGLIATEAFLAQSGRWNGEGDVVEIATGSGRDHISLLYAELLYTIGKRFLIIS